MPTTTTLRACLPLLVLATSCATVNVAQQSSGAEPRYALESNSLRLLAGWRGLDEDDWDPVEEQFAGGVEYVRESPGSFIGFEVGAQFGVGGEEVDVGVGDADVVSGVFELYAGIHKTFLRDKQVHPYLGAGVTFVSARFEVDGGPLDGDDDDTSPGAYLHGGIETALSRTMAVGLDLRAVGGTDIELFGASGDADYLQAAVFLAVGF